MQRKNISSGAPWEDIVGYSRAVRVGPYLEVSGTVATDSDGNAIGDNAAEQTRVILEKIKQAIEDAGSSLLDVVRTRVFVTDISQWEAIGKIHGEFFRDIKPASTMVEVSRLVDSSYHVEIEASAIVSDQTDDV